MSHILYKLMYDGEEIMACADLTEFSLLVDLWCGNKDFLPSIVENFDINKCKIEEEMNNMQDTSFRDYVIEQLIYYLEEALQGDELLMKEVFEKIDPEEIEEQLDTVNDVLQLTIDYLKSLLT